MKQDKSVLREKVLAFLRSGGDLFYGTYSGYYHSCTEFGWGEIWEVCDDMRREGVIKHRLIGDGCGANWSKVVLNPTMWLK